MRRLVSTLLLLLPCVLQAATLLVAPTGLDSAPCTTAQPCRTLTHAARQLRPGDTLLVRQGTYTEVLDRLLPSQTTVRAYPGERPTVRPTSRGVPVFRLDTTHSITLEGLDVDLSACPSCGMTGGWEVQRLTLRHNRLFR